MRKKRKRNELKSSSFFSKNKFHAYLDILYHLYITPIFDRITSYKSYFVFSSWFFQ